MPSPEVSPPPFKRRRISGPPPQQSHHSSPPLSSPPPSTSSTPTLDNLRIYSWNINGISPFLPPSTPPITNFLTPASSSTPPSKPPPPRPSLRANLKSWNWPHILCLQEVKIAPTDTKTPTAVRRTVNTPLDTDDENETDHDRPRRLYDAHFCLPRDPHNATGFGGKVYGVCTLVRRDVPAPTTVKTLDWDREGRLLLLEIPKWNTLLVNVYAVNGTANAYRDPDTGLRAGDRHGRKRVFHSLLRDEVRGYEEMGWDVVVAGDVNVARSAGDSCPRLRLGEEHVRSRADFEEKFIRDLGMVDTFRWVQGLRRKFTYRPRNKPWGAGGDRVDVILATKGFKAHCRVREADVLDSEEERGPSDHVPLFVELGVGPVGSVVGGRGGQGTDGKEERTED
ncbi:MAG: hypothetical protein Q9161_002530 [Pseudevernia consocians]